MCGSAANVAVTEAVIPLSTSGVIGAFDCPATTATVALPDESRLPAGVTGAELVCCAS
jgi:hypothetical protein